MKTLVVNADDFGYTPGVNRGIADACTRGIVRATTLMAVAPAFADAAARARDLPTLDIGLHAVLTSDQLDFANFPSSGYRFKGDLVFGRLHAVLTGPFRPLTGSRELCAGDGCFPRSYPAAIALLALCPPRVLRAELAAQAEKLAGAGIQPSHIDCHKHLHCLPFAWREFVAVARKSGIGHIRRPGDTVMTAVRYPAAVVAVDLAMRAGAAAGMADCPHPALRHFAGQRAVGRLDENGLLAIIAALPEGETELMVHPGYCDEALRRGSRLTDSRERELAALTAPRVREALAAAGVTLAGFRACRPRSW